ncbi:MAG: MBL fold metallo-hydrolase [Deltaproteobacteria bacterium]|nr:MBL fold metallo-hydrolase [Deltaproteobacteria bacterium]
MRITCLGAARTVTGAAFMIDTDRKSTFLVDCGMHQGGRQTEQRNWSMGLYRIPDLDGIFITHAHIDHSGLVPRLVRQGYRGPIYVTQATAELLEILWLDAAHIQEMEAEWQTRKNKRRGKRTAEPLYETSDAEKAARLLKPIALDKTEELLPGVTVRFVSAGHILGAASLHLTVEEPQNRTCLGFSGDIGRPDQLILPNPEQLPTLDYVFMETTYGGRRHKSLEDSQAELLQVIQQAYREQGKVIIPAFAVERTQEIIYCLARAYEQGELPADMPVYLDSPLAIKATEIFRRHPELMDEEAQNLLNQGQTPINLPTLIATPTTADSQRINDVAGPAIIISGSGMANAGRIKHHLKHNLWRSNCHVVIVGFQAEGTPGRSLVDGARKINLLGEEVIIKAKIHTIGGFSAHADQEELLTWLAPLVHPGLSVFLIHGEESASLAFRQVAESRFPEVHFHVPYWKETFTITTPRPAGETAPSAPVIAPADLTPWIDSISRRLTGLSSRLTATQAIGVDRSALEAALEQVEKIIKV